MNFKMNALVAAVAMTASMSASAAMTENSFQAGSISKTGDSSLILTLLDNTNNISMTVDLGFSHSSFDRDSNFSWDITSGDYADAWNSFWTTANAATTQWAVVSGDKNGTGAGAQSLFTTAQGSLTLEKTSVLTTALGGFDGYISQNNLIGNHQAVANGASIAMAGNPAYGGNVYGTTGYYAGKFGDTNGALDSNLNVWLINSASTSFASTTGGQYATVAAFNPYFNLSSTGGLTYTAAVAAVPEADSWAMLLAGLGLMGFIARRRTAA